MDDLGGYGLAITERTQKLLSSLDIVVEGNNPDGTPKSKAAILAGALNDLSTSGKLIQFKRALESVTDQEIIKDRAIERNFKDMLLVFLIQKAIVRARIEDDSKFQAHKEFIKGIQALIKESLKKEAAAKDDFIRQALLNERQGYEQQIRDRLNTMKDDSQDRIKSLQKEIADLDNQIKFLQEQKQEMFREYAVENYKILDDFKDSEGNALFEDATEEQKISFLLKVSEMLHETNREISKLDRMAEEKEIEIDNAIKAFERKIKEKENELVKASLIGNGNGKNGHDKGRGSEYVSFTAKFSIEREAANNPEIMEYRSQINKLNGDKAALKNNHQNEKEKKINEQYTKVVVIAEKIKIESVAKAVHKTIVDLTNKIKGEEGFMKVDKSVNVLSNGIDMSKKQKDLAEAIVAKENKRINMVENRPQTKDLNKLDDMSSFFDDEDEQESKISKSASQPKGH